MRGKARHTSIFRKVVPIAIVRQQLTVVSSATIGDVLDVEHPPRQAGA